METKLRYTLEDINAILFEGFDYVLPDETLNHISQIALQVGSPDYVRTPVFTKRENVLKPSISMKDPLGNSKKKRGKANEMSDADWETIATFQPTKIEEKEGVNGKVDIIRTHLNKLTDKNYIDIRGKIIEVIDKLISVNITSEDMLRFSSTIFDMASTNRFYSKVYADLYSDLSQKYEMMRETFEKNLEKFESIIGVWLIS